MNCPTCGFKFAMLMATAEQDNSMQGFHPGERPPDLMPIVCEQCGEVALSEAAPDRQSRLPLRAMTPEEVQAFETSPAWKLIEPVIRKIRADWKQRVV